MQPAASPPRATPRRGTASLRGALVDLWHVFTKDLLNAYRPEKHYMRGPGPKWHERHAFNEPFGHRATALDELYPAP